MKSIDEFEISKIFLALRLPDFHEGSVLKLLKKFKEALHPNGKFHNSDLLIPITIYYYFRNTSIDEARLIESSKITERDFHVFTIQIERYQNNPLEPSISPITRLATITNEKELLEIKEFLEFFAFCPVCNRKNDDHYLLWIYFSELSWIQELKERLLWLIRESKEFRLVFHNRILVGVPCCKCFEIHFDSNESIKEV